MNTSATLLAALQKMLDNNDLDLFSRRVLDAIADTRDMNMYRNGIDFTDAIHRQQLSQGQVKERGTQLLTELSGYTIPETSADSETLSVTEITKSYGYGKFALGPVSLTLRKGQVYGLVGENGNGKTTLLRILAKELAHDTGSISYHFEQAKARGNYDLRTRIIYIPQRTQKWHGSLLDNLRFVLANYSIPPEEIEPRVLLMVARLGLWKYKDLQWSELSSGYKMRFELARTLLRSPEILLLDEPLANLDILSQQIILEDLKNICMSPRTPIALMLSSQQLYEVEKVSDKVIFLKNGRYKDNAEDAPEPDARTLVVELDTTASRDALQLALVAIQPQKISFNGGMYILTFDSTVTFAGVLSAFGASGLEIVYIRNISSSTRRFFMS